MQIEERESDCRKVHLFAYGVGVAITLNVLRDCAVEPTLSFEVWRV